MKQLLSKFSTIALMFIMAFILAGCDFMQKKEPDPEILEIDSAEEAYDFMIEKLSSLNNLKASVKLSIISLPIEGYLDWESQRTYVQLYEKNDNNEKVITSSYYYEEEFIYIYKNSGETETYNKVSVEEKLNIDVDVNAYLKLLDKTNIDFNKISFRNDQYQFVLQFEQNSEEIELIYTYNKVKVVVKDLATITLSKDTNNFFDSFVIDKTKYE